MRDVTLEDTFFHAFTTRAFATGVPTTLSGTPVLSVLEEDNATPITTGVSVSVDRASVTGLNEATIVATAANGYELGKSYSIYISTGTVSSVSVIGEVVGQFTVGSSAAAVDLANGTDGLGAIKADTAATLTDTADMQPKLGAPAGASMSADIADLPTVSEFNARTLVAASYFDPAADTVVNVTTVATLTGHTAQTGDNFARLGPPAGASVSADIAAVKVETVLILADTSELQTDDVPGLIAALNDVSTVEVKTQITDALNVDTFAEPGQGVPAATASITTKLGFLYKEWRNHSDQTSTLYQLFNDDGTTVDQKATVSDDTTTFDRTEIVSGP